MPRHRADLCDIFYRWFDIDKVGIWLKNVKNIKKLLPEDTLEMPNQTSEACKACGYRFHTSAMSLYTFYSSSASRFGAIIGFW